MSSVSAASNATSIAGRKLEECIARRKRKLCELYSVAAQVAAIPVLYDTSHPDLVAFLEQNDLSQGRYFAESTLPRRPDHASVHAVTRPSTKSSRPKSVSPPPSHSNKKISSKPSQSNAAQGDDRADSSDDDSVLPNGHADTNARPTPDTAKSKRSPNKNTATSSPSKHVSIFEESQNAQQPAATTQKVPPVDRQPPAGPASPPYSPNAAAARAEFHKEAPSVAPDEPTNILTPAGDPTDGTPSRRASLAEETPVKEYDSARVADPDVYVPPPKPASAVDESLDDLVASAAVPAPPTGTSIGPDVASELAETVQDGQLQATNGIAAIEARIDHTGRADALQDAHVAVIDEAAQRSGHKAAEDERQDRDLELAPSAIAVVSENNLRTDSDGLVGENVAQEPRAKTTAKGGPEKLQEEVFAKELEKMPASEKPRSPSAMDIDETSPGSQLPAVLQPTKRTDHRVRKPKSKVRRRRTVILANAKDERHLEIARHLRKNQGYPDYGTPAYFRPLFKRSLLQQSNLKTIDDLLKHTSKSVNTSDHLIALREETDMRVLERIRRLQSLEGRWSYKSPAPAQELEPQICHWDLLMKDVKWLRTDFREERKLKVAIAKDLADWCAEWVNATASIRKTLQKRTKNHATNGDVSMDDQADEVPGLLAEDQYASSDEDPCDVLADFDGPACKRVKLDQTLFHSIPEYGAKDLLKDSISTLRTVAGADVDLEDDRVPTFINTERAAQGLLSTILEAHTKEPELKPEDVTCALFNPESKPLRARLNAPWAFKPPSVSMPPQAFFEHRNASQWSWEDDQMLKQYAKDFPSNWTLIADRLTSRSLFNSYVDRRTPWECYERLLGMEGPPADAQAKQYLRHFHLRIERAKETFDAHQATIREQTEQQARTTGQPVPNMPPKRFPAPLRVDRKPNKRLIAILDGARKMAKKRENQAVKQQQQTVTQQETQQQQQQQKSAQSGTRPIQTPQYWSKIKHERELREQEKLQALREQQRAQMIEAQRRQQSGQPAQLPNGVAQQLRPGSGFGTPQLPATGMSGMQNLANSQNAAHRQALAQMGTPGTMPGVSAQLSAAAIGNRTAQAQLAGQQRLAPQMTGTQANNQDNMRRMVQQMQHQSAMANFNQQQLQGQMGRSTSNNGATNGMTNAAMLSQFNNAMRSPGMQQQQQNGNGPRISPQVSQATPNATGLGQPQSLSSGHVPPIVNLQHQVRIQHPNMSQTDVTHYATEQLKQMMTQQQLLQQQMQNSNNAGIYNQTNNMIAGTPQQRAAAAAQAQAAARNNAGSPQTPSAHLAAGNPQQQQQQNPNSAQAQIHAQAQALAQAQAAANGQQPGQQSQYSAQLRQHMYNNQQRLLSQNTVPTVQSTANANAGNHRSPNTQHASPAMSMAMPSTSTGGFQRPQGPTTPAAGTGTGAAANMRPPPMNRTPSGMSVSAHANMNGGQHLSPQQQLAQLQQMQRSMSNATGVGTPTPQMMQRGLSGNAQAQAQMQMQRSGSGAGGGYVGNMGNMGVNGMQGMNGQGSPTPMGSGGGLTMQQMQMLQAQVQAQSQSQAKGQNQNGGGT